MTHLTESRAQQRGYTSEMPTTDNEDIVLDAVQIRMLARELLSCMRQ